jgi:hypothetical protein
MSAAHAGPARNVGAILKPAAAQKHGNIDMKAAVQSALLFIKDMFPVAMDIRLEEVEPSSGGWSVVVSYLTTQSPAFAVLRDEESARLYKKIEIDDKTGKAHSLKVWK